MLKLYLLIALLFLKSTIICCQQPLSKDSISYYIKKTPATVIEHVNLLYRISATYLSINPDSSLLFAGKAMELAQKNRYDSGYFLGLKYKANALLALGKANEIYQLGNNALVYADNINKQNFKGQAYFTMAIAMQYQFKVSTSLSLYTKSIPYFEEINDKKNLSRVYQNTAGLLYEQKAFSKGIEYAQKAIALNQQLYDTVQILTCKAVYGNLVYGAENLSEAVSIYKNVLGNKTFNQLNTVHQFTILHNLGSVYFDLKKYDSSLYYLELASSKKDQFQLGIFTLQHLCKTASTHIKLGNLKKAKDLLLQADKNINAETDLLDYLESQAEYYTAIKEYNTATKYLNQLIVYKDSVSNNETKTAFAEMDSLLYNNEKQWQISERDIKIKTLEISSLNKNRKIVFLGLGTITLLISSLLVYLYYRKKQQLKNKDIALLKKENEFISVKSSLEGQLLERSRISKEIHDELGSSLTSISLLTEVLKKRLDTTANPEVNKISDTSADMVDKMNEIIWALNTSNDTVNSLVAYIRKFANNFLQDANIELEFLENNIPDNTALEGTVRRNIYLTTKEALHNIVKHSGAKKVLVNVNADNGLLINIADDGKGIDINKINSFGNGLKNMKKRMEDIGGKFSIENNNGTQINLSY